MNYTPSTNFAAKDALTSGNPLKIVKGTEISAEFNTISTVFASKPDITSTIGSVAVPSGTLAQRDVTPSAGYFRFNTTLNSFEGYRGTAWASIGSGANNDFIYESDITLNSSMSLTAGKNGMTPGPVTIADGATVTIPSGSTWSIV